MGINSTTSQRAHEIADQLRAQLAGVKEHGDYFKAFCPSHDNTDTPALSVKIYDDGVWPTCFAGCETDDILAAIGWSREDIRVRAELVENPVGSRAIARTHETHEVAFYEYPDGDGHPYMRVKRTAAK